jgi:flagellar basal-body rod protein FlgC
MSKINDLFRAQRVSGTGLRVSRKWMNMISNNIANVNTLDNGVRSSDGNMAPYARQVPVFSKVLSEQFREHKVNEDVLNGVHVDEIVHVKKNVKKVYDPTHPAARKAGTVDAGYVYYPGVSISQEMADMKIASATYEANLTAIAVANKMNQQALSLGRR